MLVNSDLDGRNYYGIKIFWSKTFSKQTNWYASFASYWNRTGIHSFEGYYASTTPTLLLNSDMEGGEEPALKLFCNRYLCKFLSTLKVLRRPGIEPMSRAWKATMLTLHQRCFATPTWKKENRRIYNSSVSNIDEKILLSLNFRVRVRVKLHRTGIEPFSIDWKVTIQPLHKRCSSTQTWTVENILDLNTSEARFSWKILIRLGFCVKLELNSCQLLGDVLCYHNINDAPQLRHWKRRTSGLYILL